MFCVWFCISYFKLNFVNNFVFEGQSSIAFLFDFVEVSQDPYPEFSVLDSRPLTSKTRVWQRPHTHIQFPWHNIWHNIKEEHQLALKLPYLLSISDANASLLIYVTEPNSVRMTEVSLVSEFGARVVAKTLQEIGGSGHLATVTMVPQGSFAVQLKGVIVGNSSASNETFQRQSSTKLRASGFTVSVRRTQSDNETTVWMDERILIM